jgi:glycolate oxidase iron-sulfur subunit
MHLVDHARERIAESFVRPLPDQLLRRLLAAVLPYPARFRLALVGAALARPLAPFLPARLAAMLRLAPARPKSPSPVDAPQVFAAEGARRMRVALLSGCAQQVLAPNINEATVRLLTRHGCEVVVAPRTGCCGALVHHMGERERALAFARANIDAWRRAIEAGGLDGIVVNASGCGTQVKDYGFMLREDPDYAAPAHRISGLARDVSEVMATLGLALPKRPTGQRVAYHSACSLQHGQRIRSEPKALLEAAGFTVLDVPEGHLCCGSAGTYNMLQPELAGRLRERKLANIATVAPEIIATGNIGCMTQLSGNAAAPVVHTVELLDWATGGPAPKALAG